MKLLKFTIILFFQLSSFNFWAQVPEIEWQKCFGGSNNDVATCVKQTKDGGFIVIGHTKSNDGSIYGDLHVAYDQYGELTADVFVLRLDKNGDIKWKQCFGGTENDGDNQADFAYQDYYYSYGYIQETSDGGFIFSSVTRSNDADVSGHHGAQNSQNLDDIWVVKLNDSGLLQWQKCLGGSFGESPKCIIQTADGGFMVAGCTWSNDGDVSGNHSSMSAPDDAWLVKLSASGLIEWQHCYGGEGSEGASSVQQTSDGGYIFSGVTFGSVEGDVSGWHEGYGWSGDYITSDAWVVKISSNGILEWQRCLGGSLDERAFSVKQTLDGNYVVTGFTESSDGDVSGIQGNNTINSDVSDMWVVKLSNSGSILWEKSYGGADIEVAYDIALTFDGGYIVTGYTQTANNGDVQGWHEGYLFFSAPSSDCWLVKLDSLGTIEWQNCYGGSGFDLAYSVGETSDGGYVFAGYTRSDDGDVTARYPGTDDYFHKSMDYWVVKLKGSENPEVVTPNNLIPSFIQPNIFTPNYGDDVNEYFTFQPQHFKTFDYTIYNRWGLPLFLGNLEHPGWNGYDEKGNQANDGVYYYSYQALGLNGRLYEGQGFFHLVRK